MHAPLEVSTQATGLPSREASGRPEVGTVTPGGPPHSGEGHVSECVLDQRVMVLSVPPTSHGGGICRMLLSFGASEGSFWEVGGSAN